jgi:SAM-dependent MidA family methyltransferase
VTLREKIEQEIRERGPIPFSRYMQMCLYDPELGYYARNAEQFGKAGDFYTSSDVHAVFGRLLARQFDEMWRALGSPSSIEVLELGPGRGLFAQDVLDCSGKKFPAFFQALHYRLDESSPSLREKLQQTLKRHFETGKASLSPVFATAEGNPSDVITGDPAAERRKNAAHGASRGWEGPQDQAPEGRKNLDMNTGKGTTSVVPLAAEDDPALAAEVPRILFANEFFDALPVEILSHEGSLRISTQNGRFVETWMPPSDDELEFLDRYSVHPEPGERIEAPLLAGQFITQITSLIPHGFFVIIDYGYTRAEQLAGRHRGTVMTYRQHSASPNPYEAPGAQDITSHVNFTALAACAEQNGMHVQPLLTQSQFLMGIGEANQFADAFEECRLPQERAKVALQLKHLVTPAGMGETFHVLVGSKNADTTNLAGLSFGKNR